MKTNQSIRQLYSQVKKQRKNTGILILILIILSLLPISCTAPTSISQCLSGEAAQEVFEKTVPVHWNPYQTIEEARYTENRLIVGYTDESALESLIQTLGATYLDSIVQIQAALLQIPESVSKTLEQIRQLHPQGIRYVSPNYHAQPNSIGELVNGENLSDRSNTENRTPPNDPLFGFQWSHTRINSQSAWDQEIKGNGIIVAVFDTGVDGAHPDLEGQFVTGWEWDSETATASLIQPGDSADYNGHGTHVAGIIAAKENNSIGICGLSPASKIMPIPSLELDAFAKAKGICWAVENGAQILQNSWCFIYGGYIDVLKDAYDYAIEQDVLVVFASANSHVAENWSSPRSWPGIMVVGASDVHDQVTTFSNGCASLSVVAPGKQILSTVNMYNNGAIVDPDPGKYAYYSGTSMAAPHVSALAALLWEKHPGASAYQVRRLIEESASPIDPPSWSQPIKGHSPWTGYGRIDVAQALSLQLPQETPGNLHIQSVDESGQPVNRFFYVTLARSDGTNYWSRTQLQGGLCQFNAIDPGIYDVYIGEAPREDSIAPQAFRFKQMSVDDDTILEVIFSD